MNQTMTDEWWSPHPSFNGETAPRRILAESDGMILFSDGARRTKECTREQFDNWIKKFGCTKDPYAKRA